MNPLFPLRRDPKPKILCLHVPLCLTTMIFMSSVPTVVVVICLNIAKPCHWRTKNEDNNNSENNGQTKSQVTSLTNYLGSSFKL